MRNLKIKILKELKTLVFQPILIKAFNKICRKKKTITPKIDKINSPKKALSQL